MTGIELLGYSKNNLPLYLDLTTSHALTHFAKHSDLKSLVQRSIVSMSFDLPIIRIEIDTNNEIGLCDLVATTAADEITYAKRPLRDTYTKFVKNRISEPTSWLVIDVRNQANDEYFLYTSFIGRLAPSFPGGSFLPEQSLEFWSNHALVWGSQEVIPETITETCPW